MIENLIRNALRPTLLPVMVRKIARRAEPDTTAEATEWASARAVRVEEWCAARNASLWSETMSVCADIERDGTERLSHLEVELGGMGGIELLYFLVRLHRPDTAVETGVAAGWSSRAILTALRHNGAGRLFSSDFPYFRLRNPDRYIGSVVPDDLRAGWTLDIRGDDRALPSIVAEAGRIDFFHYDSDKSTRGRRRAMATIEPHLADGAIVLMDDIQDNVYFRDLAERSGRDATVFEYHQKYIGALGV